ncbi:MAG: hypothetical protein LBG69_03970 [Zoogloeaceae bacterium]|jgi:hypothetical protein|nr:hypothetical protein [Zoogloeaceae bacterium]
MSTNSLNLATAAYAAPLAASFGGASPLNSNGAARARDPATAATQGVGARNNTADIQNAAAPASARVTISETGQARLQAEQASMTSAPVETPRGAPVGAVSNAPDMRNETAATAFAPINAAGTADATASLAIGADAGMSNGVTRGEANATGAVAAPISVAVPAAAGNAAQSSAPVNADSPQAVQAGQRAEAREVVAQSVQNDGAVARQDASPVTARSGLSTYRGIFSG